LNNNITFDSLYRVKFGEYEYRFIVYNQNISHINITLIINKDSKIIKKEVFVEVKEKPKSFFDFKNIADSISSNTIYNKLINLIREFWIYILSGIFFISLIVISLLIMKDKK
jgi:hypothetical protein